MADQDGAPALIGFQLMSYLPKDALDRFPLGQSGAQGMIGIDSRDAGKTKSI